MYKIVNVTDKEGHIKQDFIDELKSVHLNLSGEILYPELQYKELMKIYSEIHSTEIETDIILTCEHSHD